MDTVPATLPPSTRIGRVSMRVNDLDRMRLFYGTVVGLSPVSTGEDRTVMGAGGEPLLELISDPTATERGPTDAGLFHTAFVVPTRAALGAALERVTGRWRLTGASDHHVSEALYLRDPEGNGIEIYRDRPRESWPVDEEGRVQMDTLPLDRSSLREESSGEETVPPETTVGHVHLEVLSVPESRSFYADGIGLRVRQEWGSEALFLAAGDYHHHLGLNTWNERSTPRRGRGLHWFELVVPDRDALAAVRGRLEREGFAPRTVAAHLEVADPNGIRVRVSAD